MILTGGADKEVCPAGKSAVGPARASICPVHMVWSSGKPCTNTSGRPPTIDVRDLGSVDDQRFHDFFFSSRCLRKNSSWRRIKPEWGSSSAALVCCLTALSNSPLAK